MYLPRPFPGTLYPHSLFNHLEPFPDEGRYKLRNLYFTRKYFPIEEHLKE